MKEYILYYMTEIGIVKKTTKSFSSDPQEAEKQGAKYLNDLGLCFLELRVNTHNTRGLDNANTTLLHSFHR